MNSAYDKEDFASRRVPSDDINNSNDGSCGSDGHELMCYLMPPNAEDRSILAGLGRNVRRVCSWDAARIQLMCLGGGSAAPFLLDKFEVEWARLRPHSNPSMAGSVATEQDICDVARRISGELEGVERKQAPVPKGKQSKAYYAVARGRRVGIYNSYAEAQQQTYGYTGALLMASLNERKAQSWIDEDRSAQRGVDSSSANVAHGAAS